jgi:hypothetical protein
VPLANSHLTQPIGEVLAHLEARIASLRLREAHHAEQAAFHQEEQKHCAEQLAELTTHHEALRAAASAAVRLAREETIPVSVPLVKVSLPAAGQRPRIRNLVQQAVEHQPSGESFSPSFLARFLNQSLHGTGHAPVATSQVSTVLRRLVQDGRLRLAQAGRPHREALYARV